MDGFSDGAREEIMPGRRPKKVMGYGLPKLKTPGVHEPILGQTTRGVSPPLIVLSPFNNAKAEPKRVYNFPDNLGAISGNRGGISSTEDNDNGGQIQGTKSSALQYIHNSDLRT
ncbi:hypothetical protein PV326_010060 [Microctonus aethiopoides]|nr:hypothetical protein PV326_010060 [Microctonus aethiopoides]